MSKVLNLFSSESTARNSNYIRTLSIKNNEHINFENIEQSLVNWKMPKVPTKEIYSKDSFKLLSDYHIKTIEKTISVASTVENLQLITHKDIEPIKNIGKYHYLHIGLVQVSARTLTRNGLNTSTLICLRDYRHHKFSDSLLGLVESSLNEGPVFFNSFPNFSVSLTDPGY